MTDILIPQDNARERQLLSLAARSGQLYSDLMSEFYCDYHVALQTACHKVAVLEQTVREQAEKLRNAHADGSAVADTLRRDVETLKGGERSHGRPQNDQVLPATYAT